MADGSTDPGRRRNRRLALDLAMVVALSWVGATVAGASEIIDLRIGAHSDFTRVVFELDRPTGYRIERASPEPGVWELVVSLDATSIPRKVQSTKGLIGLVRITPEGNGSVARIQLAEDGLSLKEMILANPPRIVLDVLSPQSASAAAATTTAKKASGSAAKPAEKAAPKPAAPPKPVSTEPRAPAKAPTPIETAKAETPSENATRSAAGTAPTAAAGAGTPAEAELPAKIIRLSDPTPQPSAMASGAEPSDGGATIGRDMQGDPNPPPTNRPAPAPAAERVAKRTAMPPVPASATTEPDSGIGIGTIGMGLAGLVALVGALMYLRRRSFDGDADDDYDDGVEVGGPSDRGDENPFASLRAKNDDQPVLSMSSDADGGLESFDVGVVDEDEKEAEPIEASLIGDTNISFGSSDQEVEGIGIGAGTTEGLEDESPGDEETMRMIREIERRMASLETRLDEAVDARERLERQVAAQTEELRVQRAAIARTQRAVRNMNRPEEEGPTEPALRDNS